MEGVFNIGFELKANILEIRKPKKSVFAATSGFAKCGSIKLMNYLSSCNIVVNWAYRNMVVDLVLFPLFFVNNFIAQLDGYCTPTNKRRRMRFILIMCIISMVGCASQGNLLAENAELKTQLNALRSENEQIKAEINDIKNGPIALLNNVKFLLTKELGGEAKLAIIDLQGRYPASAEAQEAGSLMPSAERLMAEKEKQRREEDRRAVLEKHINIKKDKIEGIDWYQAKLDARTYKTRLKAYFGKRKTGSPIFRMEVNYHADNWLFIRTYLIVVDGKKYKFGNTDFKRDNSAEGIWEWEDRLATSKDIAMLKEIVSSKESVIRFQGDTYYRDYTISSNEKEAIQHVLDAYEQVAGGK